MHWGICMHHSAGNGEAVLTLQALVSREKGFSFHLSSKDMFFHCRRVKSSS